MQIVYENNLENYFSIHFFLQAATSTAQYLVEIFSEESNFDWLFQIGTKLIQTDDARTSAAWKDLSINTLKMLHAKTNEN